MAISRRRFVGVMCASGVASAWPGSIVLAQRRESQQQIPSKVPAKKLSGADTSIEGAALTELAESLKGSLLLRGDPGYDGSRSIWNGMHDRYPAVIVRPAIAQDVANAVTFARERELLTAVRGGGHSWPGHSVADGALMIDLGAMSGVSIDVKRRRARAAGGALLYSLDFAAQRHGLATTAGVVSHTGVGGLTLGGGYGRLNRKFGLTIDNLVSAQIVTADGRVRRVSAEADPDLFWALRGGGGNFGVVTEFEFRLHEAGPVMLGGDIVWPLDQARELLEFFADYSMGLSDEMYVGPYMTATPDGSSVIGMDVCYAGNIASGERELAPLRQFGKPMMDAVAPAPYVTLQTRFDGAWRPGLRSYAKNGMVSEFTPGLITAMVESFDPSAGVFVGFHTAGGAVARVGETETAWPYRDVETMIVMGAAWTDPGADESMIQATRKVYAAIEPHTRGYYDNIQSDGTRVRGNYGPAYERLVSVKNKFDPKNLFRLNSNIKPTG